MVSRRVLRSYQARYSMGANKASMYDLTDAIDGMTEPEMRQLMSGSAERIVTLN